MAVDYVIDDSAQIHPKAHIDPSVVIGAGTRVWQFASVIRDAVVGEECSIATCAIVDGSVLGDRVIVSHGAFIDPGIQIGNDVFIGPNVNLCNDAWPRTDKTGFDLTQMLDQGFVTTRIEDGASLGAGVIVLPGIKIGRDVMVAAGAVVDKSIPAAHLYKRDGSMVPIDPGKTGKRMRAAPV